MAISLQFGSSWDYPPMPYLEQVAHHASKSVSTYLWLWQHKNKDNVVNVKTEKVPYTVQQSKVLFRNNLQHLVREGLVNVKEKHDSYQIELVGWDEEI